MLNIRRRVLVVGNYPADQQQSMIRFAQLLVRMYKLRSEVDFICPPVFLSRLPGFPVVARKYLGYIDKLLIFPLWLWFRACSYDMVHIADHGNAYYSFFCNPQRCVVTCHDLLAVRGSMGDATSGCSASSCGVWLQRLIISGIRRSGAVTFVSYATFDDFKRLCGAPEGQRHAVIPNPLNAPFVPDSCAFDLSGAEQALLPAYPFLLMVGSALPRKNRVLALKLLEYLGGSPAFLIVFAGAPLTPLEMEFRNEHPLGGHLVSIVDPSHALLNWLYCQAHALIFPSVSEGFGWPLIEAQACGCPVIASFISPMPEVAGQGALYCDPHDVAAFARHVHALEDVDLRSRLINLGHKNTGRFAAEMVSNSYVHFAFPV